MLLATFDTAELSSGPSGALEATRWITCSDILLYARDS